MEGPIGRWHRHDDVDGKVEPPVLLGRQAGVGTTSARMQERISLTRNRAIIVAG